MSTQTTNMPRAIERIAGQIQSIDIDTFEGDDHSRVTLLEAAQALCRRLETPQEFIQRVTYEEPSFAAALKIASDINLFDHLNDAPQTAATLAELTNACSFLLQRILRLLVAQNLVNDNTVPVLHSQIDLGSQQVSRTNSRRSSRSNSIITAITNTLSSKSSSETDAVSTSNSPVSPTNSSSAATNATNVTTPDIEATYTGTTISTALSTPSGSAAIRHLFQIHFPSLLLLPNYLAANKYDEPTDSRNGPFQSSIGHQGISYVDWLQQRDNHTVYQDTEEIEAFKAQQKLNWLQVFDPTPLIADSMHGRNGDTGPRRFSIRRKSSAHNTSTPSNTTIPNDSQPEQASSPLLLVSISTKANSVDTLLSFRHRFPSETYPGTIEFLSTSTAITALSSNLTLGAAEITLVSHDFFAPLKPHSASARIYLFESVLSSWPDKDVSVVLQDVSRSMRKGWSKLLIYDVVVPEHGASTLIAGRDLVNMALQCGKERTEREWRALIEGAGGSGVGAEVNWNGDGKAKGVIDVNKNSGNLTVNRIHSVPGSSESVIECELV